MLHGGAGHRHRGQPQVTLGGVGRRRPRPRSPGRPRPSTARSPSGRGSSSRRARAGTPPPPTSPTSSTTTSTLDTVRRVMPPTLSFATTTRTIGSLRRTCGSRRRRAADGRTAMPVLRSRTAAGAAGWRRGAHLVIARAKRSWSASRALARVARSSRRGRPAQVAQSIATHGDDGRRDQPREDLHAPRLRSGNAAAGMPRGGLGRPLAATERVRACRPTRRSRPRRPGASRSAPSP